MRALVSCMLTAVCAAQGGEFGVTFVAALPEQLGYRESHASACMREGLRATASNAYLGGINASSAVAWDIAGVLRAVATLGASPAAPVLSGCCSAALFCVAGGPNGTLAECRTHGLGGLTYDNVGWTLNSSLIPVYTCEATPYALDLIPWVGNVFPRRDERYRPGNFPRVVIDGNSLGRSTRDLTITVAGAPCTNVAICGNICRGCIQDTDCANGHVCMGAGTKSVCMLPCEDTGFSLVCPCGAVCYSISIQGTAQRANLCLAPGLVGSSSLCDGATGLFTPPMPYLDRVECDPPRGVYGQDLMPVVAGSGRQRANLLGAIGARESTPARELRGLTLSEVVGTAGLPSSSASRAVENWGGRLGGRCGRRLQPGWKGTGMSAAPLSGNGYRYTSVNNASVAFPVVVTRLGLASTGLGVRAYERMYQVSPFPRPPRRARRLSDTPMVPFWNLTCSEPGESCAYLGTIPSWLNALPSSCYTSAALCPANSKSCECPIIDACSRPTCVPLNGPTGSAGAGVCEYSPSGACESSSTPLLRPGELPSVSVYVPLPPAVSSVVPMPPPPRSNVSRPGAGVVADPYVRDPALFDGAISWAPSSAWYDPSSLPGSAVFTSRPGSLSTDYALQAAVSSADDGPMAGITLRARMTLAPDEGLLVNRTVPWDFPFFGPATNTSISQLFLSPNGYLRVVGTNACGPEAGASGAAATFCASFDTDYAGVIAPMITDLNPGQYAMAEIFTAQFDASPIAIATLNGTVALPPDFTVHLTVAELAVFAAAVPAVFTLCATTYNTGLFESSPTPPPLLPPAPAYNTHLCISGDGSIRWRNGAVFGTPAYAGGSWSSETVVPASTPYLPQASWIAGVRGLTTAWDHAATDSWFANPRWSSSGNAEPFATTFSGYARLQRRDGDVALQGTTQLVSSAAGMRQGTTTALCAMGATACASPACGLSGGGTTVTISWAGMGCGLGFEALLPAILLAPSNLRSAAPGPQTARIECLFGQASVPATWLSYNAASAVGRLTCVSPPLNAATGGVYNGSGLSARVRLPLRLQVVVPASLAAIVAGGAGVVTGAGRVPQGRAPDEWARSQGWGDEDGAYDPATGMLTLPLMVHGLVYAVAGTMLQQAAVVPIPLTFAYSDTAQSCGCGRLGAADVCDSCGVCGGDGLSRDCTGTCMGKAVIDTCGICSGGATNLLPNADMDCNGVCFGPGTGCYLPPVYPGEPIPNDGLLNTIFYLFIIITPSMLCSSMILWFAYSFFLSPFVRAREDEDTIRALQAGDPTVLGLSGGLSTEQLARIPVLPWSEGGAGLGRFDPQCSICMDEFVKDARVNRLVSCGHVFHMDCLHTWLARSTLCPVCRADQRLDGEIAAATELRRLRATEIIRERARRRIAARVRGPAGRLITPAATPFVAPRVPAGSMEVQMVPMGSSRALVRQSSVRNLGRERSLQLVPPEPAGRGGGGVGPGAVRGQSFVSAASNPMRATSPEGPPRPPRVAPPSSSPTHVGRSPASPGPPPAEADDVGTAPPGSVTDVDGAA